MWLLVSESRSGVPLASYMSHRAPKSFATSARPPRRMRVFREGAQDEGEKGLKRNIGEEEFKRGRGRAAGPRRKKEGCKPRSANRGGRGRATGVENRGRGGSVAGGRESAVRRRNKREGHEPRSANRGGKKRQRRRKSWRKREGRGAAEEEGGPRA
ncbi:uncharacterized protein LOC131023569 [Salvia miltiorrhiza]|uniref:uncharacterized protein LOC131023569 n=1 Tax=Salvia miltiorrhiza TaxID=226208 RepID=UPI0025AB9216|nr:uncharacterized protein LOC131023569 [Salvia miltiorrhiza]